jgi:hypothetical protein
MEYDPIGPLACPHCGAPMRILAFVTDTASVTCILQHLGEPTQPRVAPAAARSPRAGPPQWQESFDQRPAFDPEATEPAPAFEFDQTLSR